MIPRDHHTHAGLLAGVLALGGVMPGSGETVISLGAPQGKPGDRKRRQAARQARAQAAASSRYGQTRQAAEHDASVREHGARVTRWLERGFHATAASHLAALSKKGGAAVNEFFGGLPWRDVLKQNPGLRSAA